MEIIYIERPSLYWDVPQVSCFTCASRIRGRQSLATALRAVPAVAFVNRWRTLLTVIAQTGCHQCNPIILSLLHNNTQNIKQHQRSKYSISKQLALANTINVAVCRVKYISGKKLSLCLLTQILFQYFCEFVNMFSVDILVRSLMSNTRVGAYGLCV